MGISAPIRTDKKAENFPKVFMSAQELLGSCKEGTCSQHTTDIMS